MRAEDNLAMLYFISYLSVMSFENCLLSCLLQSRKVHYFIVYCDCDCDVRFVFVLNLLNRVNTLEVMTGSRYSTCVLVFEYKFEVLTNDLKQCELTISSSMEYSYCNHATHCYQA